MIARRADGEFSARPSLSFGTDRFFRTLYSYLKPESVRVHPDATVRPWAVCEVLGDALSFASALGYVYDWSASSSDSGTQNELC